jgi:hypothetical protein
MNIFPGIFEDRYLRVFAESIKRIGEARTPSEIEAAAEAARTALEQVKDSSRKAKSLQNLEMCLEMAYKRIGRL